MTKEEVINRITKNLKGSYNSDGIERWFCRPFHSWGGLTPNEVIEKFSQYDEMMNLLIDFSASDRMGT